LCNNFVSKNNLNIKIIKTRKANASIIIIMLLVLSNLHISAQKALPEFSIYGGGGFSFFAYQPYLHNASSGGFSGDAGVGYTFFLSQQWGIHTGAGFGLYNVKARVDYLKTITPGYIDCDGYLYDLHTTLNNYNEIHKSIFMSIPLMIQFQTKQKQSLNWKKDDKVGFYVMGGVRALFLLSNKYTSQVTSLSNMAYYPEFDNWITTLAPLGLGTFDGKSSEGTLKFGVLAMFAFETGVKWRVGKGLYLYTGAYFDCGLYDPNKDSRMPYSNYTAPEHLTDLTLLAFADRINLMTVGIKLRLAFFQIQKMDSCPYSQKHRSDKRKIKK